MAIYHAKAAELIDIHPLEEGVFKSKTTTLVKTDSLEVIRIVMPRGKQIKPHSVPGEITVQCLEGKVAFCAPNVERELTAGKLLFLAGSDEHSLRAVDDSSLLVTILLDHKE
jgi:quercetin dioxygenase-like cupin family protein